MSKIINRGFVATFAAGALLLSLAPAASAQTSGDDTIDDPDGSPIVNVPDETVREAEVYRIADATRILTAIEASQSRTDWGAGVTTGLVWDCEAPIFPVDPDGEAVPEAYELGDVVLVPSFVGDAAPYYVRCEAVLGDPEADPEELGMEIIIARSDNYPDALAAGPLADVLNAPILLNPSNVLDPAVAAEIARLDRLGGDRDTTVHLLGGTDALSNGVRVAIGNLRPCVAPVVCDPYVDEVIRYQGIDRYETAVTIAQATVLLYGIESGAPLRDVNAYITTGINFPDALAAGAAAAENDGVVVLTKGTELDERGFTEQFLINLRNLVLDGFVNTSENFAVGGPSATAAANYDIRLAPNGAYVGEDRYETATLTATATFGPLGTRNVAIASGEGFADALVAGGFIANLDGPLLLSNSTFLNDFTAEYLEDTVMNGDRIFTFGGPDSLRLAVTNEIKDLLEAKFEIDPEIR